MPISPGCTQGNCCCGQVQRGGGLLQKSPQWTGERIKNNVMHSTVTFVPQGFLSFWRGNVVNVVRYFPTQVFTGSELNLTWWIIPGAQFCLQRQVQGSFHGIRTERDHPRPVLEVLRSQPCKWRGGGSDQSCHCLPSWLRQDAVGGWHWQECGRARVQGGWIWFLTKMFHLNIFPILVLRAWWTALPKASKQMVWWKVSTQGSSALCKESSSTGKFYWKLCEVLNFFLSERFTLGPMTQLNSLLEKNQAFWSDLELPRWVDHWKHVKPCFNFCPRWWRPGRWPWLIPSTQCAGGWWWWAGRRRRCTRWLILPIDHR